MSNKPRGNTVASSSHRKAPQLPSDFAAELLETELNLDSHCDIEHVQQLVGLYQQAIEYYEFIQDQRYSDFTRRLQRVLSRPDVRSVLVANAPKPKAKKPRAKRMTVAEDQGNSPQHPIVDSEEDRLEPFQRTLSRTVTRLIDTTETMVKDTTQKIKEHIASQEVDLKRRLEARKFRLMSRVQQSQPNLVAASTTAPTAAKTPRATQPQESDISGGIPLENPDLEGNIEQLIEESYAEQERITSKVKAKYHNQIRELEQQQASSHNDLIQMVINQMKVTMEQELAEEVMKVKKQRHEAIIRMGLRR